MGRCVGGGSSPRRVERTSRATNTLANYTHTHANTHTHTHTNRQRYTQGVEAGEAMAHPGGWINTYIINRVHVSTRLSTRARAGGHAWSAPSVTRTGGKLQNRFGIFQLAPVPARRTYWREVVSSLERGADSLGKLCSVLVEIGINIEDI